MRRIVIALMSTVSGLVLLFSYHTSTNTTSLTTALPGGGNASGNGGGTAAGGTDTAPTTAAADPAPTGGTTSGTGVKSTAKSSGKATKAATKSTTTTVVGDPVMTRWGIVQVKISVKGKTITAADVVQVPMDNGHDVEINNYAVPVLNQAAVGAQNANFDGVSGATVTSDGYKQSLQSAIDKAHL